jgi:glutamate synthase domain-containing protein 3
MKSGTKTLPKEREAAASEKAQVVDLAKSTVRSLNDALHKLTKPEPALWRVKNPRGAHAIACGLQVPVTVEIAGHVGYYCAGMNQKATVIVNGNAGTGVAENMMSGYVHVRGNASQSAGATAHGGLLVIEGDASARCGISMKGVDIVVKGSVGHLSAFMAQSGNLVVCGDAGEALGDSIYEARLFVRGSVQELGTDCIEKEMRAEHRKLLAELLKKAGVEANPSEFRRYGSARKLYNFHIDHASDY